MPVLLGYLAIGTAFGLLLANAGYPWYLGLFMSIVMYAGAGQYIAVGLFATGVGLFEACIVQLVVNARHIAYGITLLKKINRAGIYKYYIIFGLTDETFALLSSIPNDDDLDDDDPDGSDKKYGSTIAEKSQFMFYVTLLDHIYWVSGSLIGSFAGALIPFNFEGIGFALTALFVVLMIEQIIRVKKALPFVISAFATIAAVIIFPQRMSLLSALVISLALVQIICGAPQERLHKNRDSHAA
ncbi:MAG: AzlC family ABC transporter permease [Termitinemataceae bacterium]|nr:MAG: AzlC family ABC transporter permease [Termitinemataceae bacterium]